MSRVYMIRHGKPKSTWGDHSDPDPGLDETGWAQAEAAGAALLAIPAQFRPISVVSSPLNRCRDTAVPFARALGVEADIDPVFGEIATPANIPHAERSAWLRRAFEGSWGQIAGDIDYQAWRAEIVEALKGRGGTAVFSHYVAINAAVSAVTGVDSVIAFRPDHCSITAFELRDGELRLVKLGRESETRIL